MLSRLCEIGALCWVAGDVTGALYKMQRHLTAERAILEVSCLRSVKKACAPYTMHAFALKPPSSKDYSNSNNNNNVNYNSHDNNSQMLSSS